MLFPDIANPRKKRPLTPWEKKIKNLGKGMKLFTVNNPKLLKGQKKDYFPMALMLAPAFLSGWEVCPFRSPGCTRACLNTSGQAGIVKGGAKTYEDVIKKSNDAQRARVNRTKWLFSKTPGTFSDTPVVPYDYADAVIHDIERLIKFCEANKMTPCIRMNGTSDLRWEIMPFQARKNIFSIFPRIQFYDYTKHPIRNRKEALKVKNYYLNYSFTEQAISSRRMREWMSAHVNTAVVFMLKPGARLPSTFAGYDVIDGDVTDLRFLDPPNSIVGLRVKGRFAQHDETGFVIKDPAILSNPQEVFDFSGGYIFPDIE